MEQFVLPYPFLAFVDQKKCIGCGLCERVCPFHAISVEETARVDSGRCTGCGACVDQCPKSALILFPRVHTRESSKYRLERSI
jgi:ferredoxin